MGLDKMFKNVTGVLYDTEKKKYSSSRLLSIGGASTLIPSGIAMINAGIVRLDIDLKAAIVHTGLGALILVCGVFLGSRAAKGSKPVQK